MGPRRAALNPIPSTARLCPRMRYIEPHGHMVSRTTDDYAALAHAGCAAICEPAFWAGFDRSSADGA